MQETLDAATIQDFRSRLRGRVLEPGQADYDESRRLQNGLIDRHPAMPNVWLVGGGSGHGFKHGPAVGEYVAARIGDGKPVDPKLALASKQEVQKRTVY